MRYRRAKTSGATYFFTVVTHQRQSLFDNDSTIGLLRQAFRSVKAESPFTIDGHRHFARSPPLHLDTAR
ncbi:hypothetical protein XM38_004210 [Halomicronema hongdechloris C2206]|uniref:Transposase n=1 Tax=Halomicronema hongdechloris C2206 TaxID=1641165 RepID=A0A1Z3HGS4_9CYAN|nr:hypothetical protein [Halomicronema hongdechloris]ASC69494.1 hypothetical protein XM38_004210 [Halomicronema hongdechloris C2206]